MNQSGQKLQNDFAALRTDYQEHHGRAKDDNRIDIEKGINTDPKSFFKDVDF
jgi:hypothetical protein